MYIDIINKSNHYVKLTSLRVCDSGGDSLPIECIKKFEKKTNAIITEGYGLTETASLTHFNISARERKPGSLGKPVREVECKIMDLDNNELPMNQWGLLWVKGPMVFNGYVGNDELTDQVLFKGWFNTNDVVKMDENGFYYIAGRLSDIQSLSIKETDVREIENIFYKFDGINRVHVQKRIQENSEFAVYDILAELKEGYSETEVYDYIGTYKHIIVNHLKIVKTMPTTSTGKIKRYRI
jgi:long-chain acyl-CoA synthetase